MQPTQVREPWVYEEKIDGWRMLADKDRRTSDAASPRAGSRRLRARRRNAGE
jgi:hypothetical protein